MRDYPECPSWRGFGRVLGAGDEQLRVLGNDGQRVRVEYLARKGRPRAWLPLDLPIFAALAKWIATGPPWVNPAWVAPVVTVEPVQVCLFGAAPKV